MSIVRKLANIQNELKAPKNQYNSFGKYKYRNCEDILEAVKPLLSKNDLILNISDEITFIGDRFYVQATAKVIDVENNFIEAKALAREEFDKKGMDASQITGSASSYARKYALNGLFCIDDTKDADTPIYATKDVDTPIYATKDEIKKIKELVKDIPALLNYYKIKKLEDLTSDVAKNIIKKKGVIK